MPPPPRDPVRPATPFLVPDYRVFVDEQSHARIHQLTGRQGLTHSLHFRNRSFRPGRPNELVFITHGDRGPELRLYDLSTQKGRTLGDRPDLLAFSPAFSPDGKYLYFATRSSEIWRLTIDGPPDQLRVTELPGALLGICRPSHDGKYLALACHRGGKYGLLLIDLAGRRGRVIVESDRLLSFPQFHPHDSNRLLYSLDPAPHLWMINRDGSHNECLHKHRASDFVIHPSFLGAGDDIIFSVWPHRLCRLNLYDRRVEVIAHLNAWHPSSNIAGTQIVTDTAHPDRGILLVDPETGKQRPLCRPRATCQGTQWRQERPAGPEVWAEMRGPGGRPINPMDPRTDTVYGPEWTHPHPSFDESGTRVIYTSDHGGFPQVFVAEIPPEQPDVAEEPPLQIGADAATAVLPVDPTPPPPPEPTAPPIPGE